MYSVSHSQSGYPGDEGDAGIEGSKRSPLAILGMICLNILHFDYLLDKSDVKHSNFKVAHSG